MEGYGGDYLMGQDAYSSIDFTLLDRPRGGIAPNSETTSLLPGGQQDPTFSPLELLNTRGDMGYNGVMFGQTQNYGLEGQMPRVSQSAKNASLGVMEWNQTPSTNHFEGGFDLVDLNSTQPNELLRENLTCYRRVNQPAKNPSVGGMEWNPTPSTNHFEAGFDMNSTQPNDLLRESLTCYGRVNQLAKNTSDGGMEWNPAPPTNHFEGGFDMVDLNSAQPNDLLTRYRRVNQSAKNTSMGVMEWNPTPPTNHFEGGFDMVDLNSPNIPTGRIFPSTNNSHQDVSPIVCADNNMWKSGGLQMTGESLHGSQNNASHGNRLTQKHFSADFMDGQGRNADGSHNSNHGNRSTQRNFFTDLMGYQNIPAEGQNFQGIWKSLSGIQAPGVGVRNWEGFSDSPFNQSAEFGVHQSAGGRDGEREPVAMAVERVQLEQTREGFPAMDIPSNCMSPNETQPASSLQAPVGSGNSVGPSGRVKRDKNKRVRQDSVKSGKSRKSLEKPENNLTKNATVDEYSEQLVQKGSEQQLNVHETGLKQRSADRPLLTNVESVAQLNVSSSTLQDHMAANLQGWPTLSRDNKLWNEAFGIGNGGRKEIVDMIGQPLSTPKDKMESLGTSGNLNGFAMGSQLVEESRRSAFRSADRPLLTNVESVSQLNVSSSTLQDHMANFQVWQSLSRDNKFWNEAGGIGKGVGGKEIVDTVGQTLSTAHDKIESSGASGNLKNGFAMSPQLLDESRWQRDEDGHKEKWQDGEEIRTSARNSRVPASPFIFTGISNPMATEQIDISERVPSQVNFTGTRVPSSQEAENVSGRRLSQVHLNGIHVPSMKEAEDISERVPSQVDFRGFRIHSSQDVEAASGRVSISVPSQAHVKGFRVPILKEVDSEITARFRDEASDWGGRMQGRDQEIAETLQASSRFTEPNEPGVGVTEREIHRQWLGVNDESRGRAENITEKNMIDKSMTEKCITGKIMTEKNVTEENVAGKNMTEKTATENNVTGSVLFLHEMDAKTQAESNQKSSKQEALARIQAKEEAKKIKMEAEAKRKEEKAKLEEERKQKKAEAEAAKAKRAEEKAKKGEERLKKKEEIKMKREEQRAKKEEEKLKEKADQAKKEEEKLKEKADQEAKKKAFLLSPSSVPSPNMTLAGRSTKKMVRQIGDTSAKRLKGETLTAGEKDTLSSKRILMPSDSLKQGNGAAVALETAQQSSSFLLKAQDMGSASKGDVGARESVHKDESGKYGNPETGGSFESGNKGVSGSHKVGSELEVHEKQKGLELNGSGDNVLTDLSVGKLNNRIFLNNTAKLVDENLRDLFEAMNAVSQQRNSRGSPSIGYPSEGKPKKAGNESNFLKLNGTEAAREKGEIRADATPVHSSPLQVPLSFPINNLSLHTPVRAINFEADNQDSVSKNKMVSEQTTPEPKVALSSSDQPQVGKKVCEKKSEQPKKELEEPLSPWCFAAAPDAKYISSLESERRWSSTTLRLPEKGVMDVGLKNLDSTTSQVSRGSCPSGPLRSPGSSQKEAVVVESDLMMSARWRLRRTVRLMQNLFPPMPAGILKSSSKEDCECGVYLVAREMMGEACARGARVILEKKMREGQENEKEILKERMDSRKDGTGNLREADGVETGRDGGQLKDDTDVKDFEKRDGDGKWERAREKEISGIQLGDFGGSNCSVSGKGGLISSKNGKISESNQLSKLEEKGSKIVGFLRRSSRASDQRRDRTESVTAAVLNLHGKPSGTGNLRSQERRFDIPESSDNKINTSNGEFSKLSSLAIQSREVSEERAKAIMEWRRRKQQIEKELERIVDSISVSDVLESHVLLEDALLANRLSIKHGFRLPHSKKMKFSREFIAGPHELSREPGNDFETKSSLERGRPQGTTSTPHFESL